MTKHEELTVAAKEAYEALLVARALLAGADISTKGGRIEAAIDSLGYTLYPPSSKSIDAAIEGASGKMFETNNENL